MNAEPLALPPALRDALAAAERIVALTGSGISADSGVPTFREAQTGIWAQFRPEELATPQAFERNPRQVWDWYTLRRNMIAAARPNAGHAALARLQAVRPDTVIVTQNVDGLHQAAGAQRVIELHGNITRDRCHREGRPVSKPVRDPEWDMRPPRCPDCGSLVRPDVVWFGENLPQADLALAAESAARCDLFMSIGTSSLVQPAASLGEAAMRAGARVIEINPDETPLSSLCDFVIRESASVALPLLISAVR